MMTKKSKSVFNIDALQFIGDPPYDLNLGSADGLITFLGQTEESEFFPPDVMELCTMDAKLALCKAAKKDLEAWSKYVPLVQSFASMSRPDNEWDLAAMPNPIYRIQIDSPCIHSILLFGTGIKLAQNSVGLFTNAEFKYAYERGIEDYLEEIRADYNGRLDEAISILNSPTKLVEVSIANDDGVKCFKIQVPECLDPKKLYVGDNTILSAEPVEPDWA
jgi:hypothetical protein